MAGASSSGSGGGAEQQQQHYHVSKKMGPAAAKLLRESGLSPDAVKPSGPHDIVTKGDVLAAIAAGVKARPPEKVPAVSYSGGSYQRPGSCCGCQLYRWSPCSGTQAVRKADLQCMMYGFEQTGCPRFPLS